VQLHRLRYNDSVGNPAIQFAIWFKKFLWFYLNNR